MTGILSLTLSIALDIYIRIYIYIVSEIGFVSAIARKGEMILLSWAQNTLD